MEKYGFYIIKDEFFIRFSDPNLKGNKSENRPHYYCFEDNIEGLHWVIPMSSRVEKYKSIIRHKQETNRPCDGLYICRINDKESVFLIQDMFPVTESYIKRPYTIGKTPLFLLREKDRNTINSKALRIHNLINKGIRFNAAQADVLKIKAELSADLRSRSGNEFLIVK